MSVAIHTVSCAYRAGYGSRLHLPYTVQNSITDGIARFAGNEGSGSLHGIDYVAGAFALTITGVRVLPSES